MFNGSESMCWKCGVVIYPFARTVDPRQIHCHRCEAQAFDAARACGIYEVALRQAILRLKRLPHLSNYLVSFLSNVAKSPPMNEATRIIPVPLHPERQRQRGFNQAAVIARAIGPALRVVVDEATLIRVTAAKKYRAGLDQKGRFESVADAFKVRFPSVVSNEVVLLVDDVLTTGATASSCALTLKEAGARAVVVLTLARQAN